MLTNPTKPIGYRSPQPFMGDPKGIGWRLWVGRLIVSKDNGRLHVRFTA